MINTDFFFGYLTIYLSIFLDESDSNFLKYFIPLLIFNMLKNYYNNKHDTYNMGRAI